MYISLKATDAEKEVKRDFHRHRRVAIVWFSLYWIELFGIFVALYAELWGMPLLASISPALLLAALVRMRKSEGKLTLLLNMRERRGATVGAIKQGVHILTSDRNIVVDHTNDDAKWAVECRLFPGIVGIGNSLDEAALSYCDRLHVALPAPSKVPEEFVPDALRHINAMPYVPKHERHLYV